jgi:hypothetical protein
MPFMISFTVPIGTGADDATVATGAVALAAAG